MAIESFAKDSEYFFLSSMFPLENGVETLDGLIVDCVEIGYQADKWEDEQARQRVLSQPNGYAAKSMSKTLKFKEGMMERPDWADAKVNVMRWYVYQKFTRNPDVAVKLLATGGVEIIEGNKRKDTFWGVCPPGSGNGKNMLGRILMETRDWLRGELPSEPVTFAESAR